MQGELKLISAPYEEIETQLTPAKGLDVGGGKNEKSRWTVILGATSEGTLYPPVVIIPHGKYPGVEWKPSEIEISKDKKAADMLKLSRK